MTPLRRFTRIKPIGKRHERWKDHQMRSRTAVVARARGRCERPGCEANGTDWAHAYGRRHIIGEPLCSLPELTFLLCRDCHREMDLGQTAVQWWSRVLANERLCESFNLEVTATTRVNPVDWIRGIERLYRRGELELSPQRAATAHTQEN